MEPVFTRSEYYKYVIEGASTLDEMATMLEEEAISLRAMHAAGVTLDQPVVDGYAHFSTESKAVAEEFGFEDPFEDPDADAANT